MAKYLGKYAQIRVKKHASERFRERIKEDPKHGSRIFREVANGTVVRYRDMKKMRSRGDIRLKVGGKTVFVSPQRGDYLYVCHSMGEVLFVCTVVKLARD